MACNLVAFFDFVRDILDTRSYHLGVVLNHLGYTKRKRKIIIIFRLQLPASKFILVDLDKRIVVSKTYPASGVHEYVIERVIIDLHSNNSYRGFLGSFSNHDGMSSCNGGWLLPNIKRDRVNKCVTINLVVVHGPLVPGFIRSLVVDISKVSKNKLIIN